MNLDQAINRLRSEAKHLVHVLAHEAYVDGRAHRDMGDKTMKAHAKLRSAIDRLAEVALGRDVRAPRCSQCGIELTTALVAVVCPRRDACAFWPDDEAGRDFVRMMRDDDTRSGGHDIEDKP